MSSQPHVFLPSKTPSSVDRSLDATAAITHGDDDLQLDCDFVEWQRLGMGDTVARIAKSALLVVTAFALALAACNDDGDERPGLAEIRARGLVCNVSPNGLQPGAQMIFPAGQTGSWLESRYRTTNDLVGDVQWRPIGTRYRGDQDVLLAAEPVRMRPLTTVRQTGDGIVVTFLPTPSTPLTASCVVPEQELSVPDGVGDRAPQRTP